MKSVEMHGLAVREAGSAYRWYFDRSRAAAERFSEQLYAAIQRVAENPERYPSYLAGTRRYRLNRFPYLVVYLYEADRVQVIAVAHAKRRPGYWARRLP